MYDYDFVIMGAGPAGLAAAMRMSGHGHRVALVDAGKPIGERDRAAETEMTRGHGGAGLFSDGKFSFFPSATELWCLPAGDALRSGYQWTCAVLGDAGLDTPPFPERPTDHMVDAGEWALKEYPSDYLPLDTRLRLTADMVAAVEAEKITENEVGDVRYDPEADVFHLRLCGDKGQQTLLRSRRLLIATGRFGPFGLTGLTAHRHFRRLEVGVRIEQAAEHAFFRDMRQLDPKLRLGDASGAVEWRTFCACRQGEAVLTETQGLWTVSGRSDCPPTGRSNVGFNTRVLDESIASAVFAPALAAMSDRESYFEVEMGAALRGDHAALTILDGAYGPVLRELMIRGLTRLGERFPELPSRGARLIGPTLEGVGWYPRVDGALRLLDTPAWVAGDACGLFRGIVAAMISGHYAASSALADLGAR